MTFESDNTELPEPRWIGRKKSQARTPLANGTRLVMGDRRSLFSKRYSEICSAHVSDLGGFENLSASELAVVKRCATIQVCLEEQETRLANGETKDFSLVEYSQCANGMRRLLEALHSQTLKRVPKDCTLSLADILREHSAATIIEEKTNEDGGVQ